MHGRQQRQGADWQGGTGRRARWAAAAWEDAHAGGKRERARAGGSLQVLSARNQGGSGVYIGMERGFLACVPREESGCGSGCREEKRAGLLVWAEKVFPIFFLFAKRFNKFDLNLNSTNSNSNQTTRNKTMQSGMSANKQPHLDLEKQLIFILTKFPVKKISVG